MDVPETRFAQVGEDRVAYQVFGDGPPDVVYMQGVTETIDLRWEWPPYAHFLRRLASFSRVVTFDQRGQGASDRVSRSGGRSGRIGQRMLGPCSTRSVRNALPSSQG